MGFAHAVIARVQRSAGLGGIAALGAVKRRYCATGSIARGIMALVGRCAGEGGALALAVHALVLLGASVVVVAACVGWKSAFELGDAPPPPPRKK